MIFTINIFNTFEINILQKLNIPLIGKYTQYSCVYTDVANNTMSEKRHRNRRQFKKVKPNLDSLIESDEHFGFIAGYTSNGVPYGLTHEEWDEINSEQKTNKIEKDDSNLPF